MLDNKKQNLNFFKKLINNLKINRWLFIIGALLLLGGIYYFTKSENSKKMEEYTIKRGNLNEAVSLTGRVQPTQEANINFEKSGTIRTINVKIGDRVYKGQILATLSDATAYGRIAEARASLNASLAQLEELKNGPRNEQIELKKLAVENLNSQIDNQYKSIEDTIKTIAITSNDVVRNRFSGIFDGGSAEGYRIKANSCTSLNENIANNLRKDADIAVDNLQNIANTFALSSDKTNEIIKIKNNLSIITNFLTSLNNVYRAECILSDSSYDFVRSTISNSQTNIQANKSELNTKTNILDTLKVQLKQANEDLKLTQNGERNERIKSAQAAVEGARARLSIANAEANKNTLEAPFSGIITAVDMKIGEFVTVGSNKNISIISDNNFQIESKVSEIDVAKLSKNQKAQVTFDSYGNDVKFDAIVSNISPAGIITDGVPTYKTIFNFTNKDERIKSGMTANIKVTTKTYENVLSLPIRFTKTKNGNKIVSVKNSEGKIEEKIIVVGAKGLNGEVKVESGLNEGDVVVIKK